MHEKVLSRLGNDVKNGHCACYFASEATWYNLVGLLDCEMELRSDEDDFFGEDEGTSDQDHSCLVDVGGSHLHSGLQAADWNAEQGRFRTLGYHEAYDSCKGERLQAGFQDGYRSTYEDAHRIGELIGRVVMQSKVDAFHAKQEGSDEGEDASAPTPVANRIAQAVRSYVVIPENQGKLPRLEAQIRALLLEASSQN